MIKSHVLYRLSYALPTIAPARRRSSLAPDDRVVLRRGGGRKVKVRAASFRRGSLSPPCADP